MDTWNNNAYQKVFVEYRASETLSTKVMSSLIIIYTSDVTSFWKTYIQNSPTIFLSRFKRCCCIASSYSILDKLRLKTESEVIYKIEDLKKIVSVMNVLPFVFDNNIHQFFIKTSKIITIIVTNPIRTAEAVRTFLTLKNIFLGI